MVTDGPGLFINHISQTDAFGNHYLTKSLYLIYTALNLESVVSTVQKVMTEFNSGKSKTYLFIDESGDPSFYASGNRCIVGEQGFKPLLLIGMIKVEDKKALRNAILSFMEELKNDPLYNELPCITNPKGWYLHVSYDNIEVQVKFIAFLRQLPGFKFYCVIGRKRLDLFQKKHNSRESEFYFDLVHHLIKDRLNDEETDYQVLLSARSKSNQRRLSDAITKALERDNLRRKVPKAIRYNCEIVQSRDTPELSVVDFMLWALQRYILKGEARFYKALEEKYNLVIDLYDFDKYKAKGQSNYYSTRCRFSLDQASPFLTDGYVKKKSAILPSPFQYWKPAPVGIVMTAKLQYKIRCCSVKPKLLSNTKQITTNTNRSCFQSSELSRFTSRVIRANQVIKIQNCCNTRTILKSDIEVRPVRHQ